MRRALLAATVALLLLLVPAGAGAHPLGNFTINHVTTISLSRSGAELRYVLDQAEIPTFQERGRSRAEVLADKAGKARDGLVLTVGGRRVPLRVLPGARLSFPPGQGGLATTRVEVPLRASVDPTRGRVELRDETFAGRVGWRAIVARPGTGTAVRSTAPSGDPTAGLRSYPKDTLSSPLDIRTASFSVRPGDGTLSAPPSPGGKPATTRERSGDGFASVFSDAIAGRTALLLLVLAAFAWGAFHALSPGHGKAMVAAYLVGARGTSRQALALGATVTVTHTIGVFALGFVTLALSEFVLPEQLYPWLNLASGVLVVMVGVAVLRARVRNARRSPGPHSHGHHHHHHHHHPHDHLGQPDREGAGPEGHAHEPDHERAGSHGHSHDIPDRLTWRGLIAMGASAGLIPCPSALVVLLAAIAQHRVALGLLLILAFSLGLAATLSVLGLLVVHAGRVAGRATARVAALGPVVTALPAVSALVIVGAGVLLTARAVPTLGV
jgi:ABC-type nickel/cobalt efflux system permease component RcnA